MSIVTSDTAFTRPKLFETFRIPIIVPPPRPRAGRSGQAELAKIRTKLKARISVASARSEGKSCGKRNCPQMYMARSTPRR